MTLNIGSRLGPYEILARLGEGGMGEVYQARDTRLNRTIAIKVLHAAVADDPERLRRFEQEAQSASALNHPNIITIHDIGRDHGVRYIAMEWVQGHTLRDLFVSGPMPAGRFVRIAHQMAEGLSKAHAAGIVHRDLKPENVMVSDDGLVKIVDFGLAKLGEPSSDLSQLATTPAGTVAGVVMGTVGYMSPEQASGRMADYRSDQFGLGLITYEAVTGKRPFARETVAQTLAATIDVDPEPVSTLNPEITPQLAVIIHRCLEKNPANRYQSTRDLAHDLKQVAEGGAARTSAASLGPPFAHRLLAIAIGAALLLLAMLTGAWLWLDREKSPDAPAQPLLAVRPFRNLSQDPSQNYFADGVTEEIRGQLSKIAALRVLSGSAVEKFGEGEGPKMAREFGVDSIVEGSVRLAGNRVRVAVELVDATTQQTRWSEQYERDIADVLSVQSDVALRIAQTLAANLSPSERARVVKRPTQNADAYQLYLRSQSLSFADRERNLQAIDLLKQALALDPTFAAATARLSYRVLFRGYLEDPKYLDEAIALALEAAASDPMLSDPHSTLGAAYSQKGRIEQSRLSFMRALELNPNHVGSMQNLSIADLLGGKVDESLYWARRAFPLSAQGGNDYHHVSVPLLLLRDDQLTRRWLAEAERHFADFPRTHLVFAGAQVYGGDVPGALARLRAAALRFPDNDEVAAARVDLAVLINASDAESLSEEMFRASPDVPGIVLPETARLRFGYLLDRRGDPRGKALLADAESRARQQIAAGDHAQLTFVELAAARALQGDTKGALVELQRAYDNGWRDYGIASVDPMLRPLRDEPGFRALVDLATRDIAAQRQRAKERGLMDLEPLVGRPLP